MHEFEFVCSGFRVHIPVRVHVIIKDQSTGTAVHCVLFLKLVDGSYYEEPEGQKGAPCTNVRTGKLRPL